MGNLAQCKAAIRNIAGLLWEHLPGHTPGAISKMLVRPDTAGSQLVDFRSSTCQPTSCVESHTHRVKEQIYHLSAGVMLMEIDETRRVARPGDCIFIPPGIGHAIYNTGLGDQTFFVIKTPPDDEMR